MRLNTDLMNMCAKFRFKISIFGGFIELRNLVEMRPGILLLLLLLLLLLGHSSYFHFLVIYSASIDSNHIWYASYLHCSAAVSSTVSCNFFIFRYFLPFLASVWTLIILLLPSVTPPTSKAYSFYNSHRRFINTTSMESLHLFELTINKFFFSFFEILG